MWSRRFWADLSDVWVGALVQTNTVRNKLARTGSLLVGAAHTRAVMRTITAHLCDCERGCGRMCRRGRSTPSEHAHIALSSKVTHSGIVACMSDIDDDQELQAFVRERDWDQFHSPENLAKSIVIEAGELIECFQWGEPTDNTHVEEELADVLTYCHLLAMKIGRKPGDLILEKLTKTREKYPVSLSKGRSTKYDKL